MPSDEHFSSRGLAEPTPSGRMRSRRHLSAAASAMSRRSCPGSASGHRRLGWALTVLCGLATSIVSATPLRVQFLHSISDEKSSLVRGYESDEPLLVRVPRRFFEAGDVCAVSDCSRTHRSWAPTLTRPPLLSELAQRLQVCLERRQSDSRKLVASSSTSASSRSRSGGHQRVLQQVAHGRGEHTPLARITPGSGACA